MEKTFYEPFKCIAEGTSMEPTIKSGNTITLIKSNHYKINDIVLFNLNNYTFLHRIVCTFISGKKKFFITRGDANNIDDKPIMENQIIGKVVHIEK